MHHLHMRSAILDAMCQQIRIISGPENFQVNFRLRAYFQSFIPARNINTPFKHILSEVINIVRIKLCAMIHIEYAILV